MGKINCGLRSWQKYLWTMPTVFLSTPQSAVYLHHSAQFWFPQGVLSKTETETGREVKLTRSPSLKYNWPVVNPAGHLICWPFEKRRLAILFCCEKEFGILERFCDPFVSKRHLVRIDLVNYCKHCNKNADFVLLLSQSVEIFDELQNNNEAMLDPAS